VIGSLSVFEPCQSLPLLPITTREGKNTLVLMDFKSTNFFFTGNGTIAYFISHYMIYEREKWYCKNGRKLFAFFSLKIFLK
jgi:hypothetical protein